MEQSASVTVRFGFAIYDEFGESDTEEYVFEPSSAADFARVRQALPQNDEHSGVLVISSPDNVDVEIRDSLDALVMQLCFGSLADLAAEKHVVVRHYMVYGYIRLDPEGDLTLISGDYVPKVRVSRVQLIGALFQAGERYIQFIKNLAQSAEEFADLLELLDEYHSEAAQALADPHSDE